MAFLVYYITTLLVFDDPKFQEFLLNNFQCRNVGVKSVGTKVDHWENALKVSYMIDSVFSKPNISGEGCKLDLRKGGCNGCFVKSINPSYKVKSKIK